MDNDKIISCGPDEYDPGNKISDTTEWCVYWYEDGGYDGNGIAYMCNNGKIYHKGLGHCSCYGAWDNNDDWCEIDSSELRMQLTGKPDSKEKAIEKAIVSVCSASLRKELIDYSDYTENSGPDYFY